MPSPPFLTLDGVGDEPLAPLQVRITQGILGHDLLGQVFPECQLHRSAKEVIVAVRRKMKRCFIGKIVTTSYLSPRSLTFFSKVPKSPEVREEERKV